MKKWFETLFENSAKNYDNEGLSKEQLVNAIL